ncbi:MAG: hypothetical protein ACKOOF_00060 [Planctomycetaceae bacterium]
MPRFIILEHTAAPDDPAGLHYDLLLEAGPTCRTWRLAVLPTPDGAAVTAVEIAAHRLAWLDCDTAEVSGGRGRVRRIRHGGYRLEAGAAGDVATARAFGVILLDAAHGGDRLRLEARDDGWTATLGHGGGGMMDPPPETKR